MRIYAHLIASWNHFSTDSLTILPLDGKYFVKHFQSILGFKIVIQLVPFVFYQFMNESQRQIWVALSDLGTYIFQTPIRNMNQYLEQLKMKIYHFIHQVSRWMLDGSINPSSTCFFTYHYLSNLAQKCCLPLKNLEFQQLITKCINKFQQTYSW